MTQYSYVYLLLDPRRFYLPFYIGKGTGNRAAIHMTTGFASRDPNRLKQNVINKIREAGSEPKVMIWATDLTEEEAFLLETQLVEKFGLRVNKTGILTNMSYGGLGGIRRIQSSEEKAKRANSLTGAGNGNFGKTWEQIFGEEGAKVMREKRKLLNPTLHTPESNQKRREKLIGRESPNKGNSFKLSPEQIEKRNATRRKNALARGKSY